MDPRIASRDCGQQVPLGSASSMSNQRCLMLVAGLWKASLRRTSLRRDIPGKKQGNSLKTGVFGGETFRKSTIALAVQFPTRSNREGAPRLIRLELSQGLILAHRSASALIRAKSAASGLSSGKRAIVRASTIPAARRVQKITSLTKNGGGLPNGRPRNARSTATPLMI